MQLCNKQKWWSSYSFAALLALNAKQRQSRAYIGPLYTMPLVEAYWYFIVADEEKLLFGWLETILRPAQGAANGKLQHMACR